MKQIKNKIALYSCVLFFEKFSLNLRYDIILENRVDEASNQEEISLKTNN